MTKAEARQATLEARRIILRIRREAADDSVRSEADLLARAFSPLLSATYEGEQVVFACKR